MKSFLILVPLFSVLPMVPLVEEKGVALPEQVQVVYADAKIPKDIECKDGTCSIVRRTVTVERTSAAPAARSGGCAGGPVARAAGATGRVMRAVAYRATHPFRGRFRR